MSLPLLKRNMKQMMKPYVILLAVLSMYYGVIIYMYDPKLMDMLNGYQEMMPQMMEAFGMTGVTDTLLKFMNTYLYGFLMLLFPLIYLVILGNQLVMNYEDTGSLACLLATPNSRKKIILTQAFSMIGDVILLIGSVALVGFFFAEGMFPGELDLGAYWKLNGFAVLLQLAVSGILFCSACFFQESRYYYVAGCGIPLVFYLFGMLGNMGDKFTWMKNCSIYSLLPADKIVAEADGTGGYLVALLAIIVVLYGAGIWRFVKKDFFL